MAKREDISQLMHNYKTLEVPDLAAIILSRFNHNEGNTPIPSLDRLSLMALESFFKSGNMWAKFNVSLGRDGKNSVRSLVDICISDTNPLDKATPQKQGIIGPYYDDKGYSTRGIAIWMPRIAVADEEFSPPLYENCGYLALVSY